MLHRCKGFSKILLFRYYAEVYNADGRQLSHLRLPDSMAERFHNMAIDCQKRFYCHRLRVEFDALESLCTDSDWRHDVARVGEGGAAARSASTDRSCLRERAGRSHCVCESYLAEGHDRSGGDAGDMH